MRGTRQLGFVAGAGVAMITMAACAVSPSTPGETSTARPSVSASGESMRPSPTPGTSSTSPAASPTPTPSSTAGPTTEPRADTTVLLSGDLLWHRSLWLSAADEHARTGNGKDFDFLPMFADVVPLLNEADLAVCHGEVPFAPEGGPYTAYPLFAAPPEIAGQLKQLGWDLCTTNSNHSLDQHFDGLTRTLDVYERAGILTTGTWASEADRNTPVIFTTEEGVKVSIVGGTYGTNGIPLPPGKEWAVAMLDPDDIIARGRAARAAGADIVLAHMHAGDEYATQPNGQQVEVAKKLVASGEFDLVYGQHVHVVQPWTKVDDTFVIYGLGNLVAQHFDDTPRGQEGMIAMITFGQADDGTWLVKTAEYVPTLTTRYSAGPVRLLQLNKAVDSGTGDQARYRAGLNRTRDAVLSLGVQGITER